jgi:hypothetical protein
MTYSLAFSALPAGHSQQRARCSTTGRFVRWALAPSLRVCGVAVDVSVVVAEAPVAPVAAVVASPVVVTGGVAVVAAQTDHRSVVASAPVSVSVRRRGTGLVGRALVALRSAGRRAAAAVAESARSLARVAGGRLARFAGVAALVLALAGDASPVADVPVPAQVAAAQVAAARFDRGGVP